MLSSAILALPLLTACGEAGVDVSEKEGALLTSFANLSEYRSIDGEGNNQQHHEWGAHGEPVRRLGAAAYEDGASTPAGADRSSPRAISNAVVAQSESHLNPTGATDMFWLWGQFLDHDITIIEATEEDFSIDVPQGDAHFDPFNTGTATIPLNRSTFVEIDGVREHANEITAYIDASNVYGSTDATASALRTNDGTGRLRTSDGDLLPLEGGFFFAGDIRSNEHVYLTAMHTLWVREHNYWADFFRAANQSGEESYQLARAMVAAEMQAITYNEFVPLLVGKNALSEYTGYKSDVSAQMSQEFSVAAYRLGHSMLSSELQRLDVNGDSIPQGPLLLRNAFFNPSEVAASGGITPLLRGMAGQQAQEIDEKIIDDVRNFLFGPPGAGGFDLASLNLQRGRDHGLPSLGETRLNMGLPAINSFADISSDPVVQANLASVYDDPANVDLWVGGLAEDAVDGSQLGQTFQAIIVDQFTRLRDGDRFFYKSLPNSMRAAVENTTLSTIIQRNTEATAADLQYKVMQITPDAADSTLGFESAGDWAVSGGSASASSDYVTDGSSSLEVSGYNVSVSTDVPASSVTGSELLVDVYIPDSGNVQQMAGVLEAKLQCPDAGVGEHQFSQYQLPGVPRGQFTTASFSANSGLQAALAASPDANCTLTLRILNGGGDFVLDRVRAE